MNKRKKRIFFICFVILLYAAPIYIKSQYLLTIAIFILIYSVLALGLRIIMKLDQISFAHAAFMGVGAYSSALLTMKVELPFSLALIISCIITAIFALVLGSLAVRTKGVHFFIVTLAMGETIRLLIMNWNAPLLGGPNGIYGIPAPGPVVMGSIVIPLDSRAGFYLIALIALTAVVFLSVLIDRSRVGRIWDAIGMDDMLAGVIGVNVYRHRLTSFVISSTIAGLAGVVFAHMMTYISPYDFTFFFAVQVLVYVIFGGASTLMGPIVGVTVLMVMSEILREVGHYELILYGFIVILVLRFFPGGAIGLIRRVLKYNRDTFGFHARRIRGGQSRE